MVHVVLLGDSIFDNARYVPGRPDVVEQVRRRLSPGGRATLLAVDGDVTLSVPEQLRGLPPDATHLVVSVGGNDALSAAVTLAEPAESVREALVTLHQVCEEFREHYRTMLDAVAQAKLPTVVCTIYEVPSLDVAHLTALALFNEAILKEAARHGLPTIDLRLVCTDRDDYSPLSPIEPSFTGGAKIARVVAKVVAEHDFAKPCASLYV